MQSSKISAKITSFFLGPCAQALALKEGGGGE